MKNTTNKIAVCICGQMRSFRQCAPFINKNLIENNDADVFIHTWKKSGHSTKIKVNNKDIIITKKLLKNTYSNYKDAIIEEFKSKYYKQKDNVKIPKELIEAEPDHWRGNIPLFYGMYKCNELRKKHGHYDVIIKARPDIMIKSNLNLLNTNIGNILYSPSSTMNPTIQICDKFVFGNEQVMNYYFSVWKKLNKYWKNPVHKNKNKNPIGERLLKHHMNISKYNYTYFSFNFHVVRVQ